MFVKFLYVEHEMYCTISRNPRINGHITHAWFACLARNMSEVSRTQTCAKSLVPGWQMYATSKQ